MNLIKIETLLHVYHESDPLWSFQRVIKYKEAIAELLNMGMVGFTEPTAEAPRGNHYLTEQALVYITALNAVPLPVRKTIWEIPK
jgi:hypothetical protein